MNGKIASLPIAIGFSGTQGGGNRNATRADSCFTAVFDLVRKAVIAVATVITGADMAANLDVLEWRW
jgi:hypothetical protein